mmetsp:Transcript_58645/g.136928  ORF Transcript_58645/g.136928 Transcript_58645/m.136928 type:complete len:212 (-) Transcript_58645:22-657(-)
MAIGCGLSSCSSRRSWPGRLLQPGWRQRRLVTCSLFAVVWVLCHPARPCFSIGGSSRRQLGLMVFGSIAASNSHVVSASASGFSGLSLALWEGRFSDLQHPGCRREILKEGLQLTISFEESTGGCGRMERRAANKRVTSYSDRAEGTEVRSLTLTGSLADKMAEEATFDFTPIGGPAAIKGKWGGYSIIFEDGTEWSRLGGLSKGAALRRP